MTPGNLHMCAREGILYETESWRKYTPLPPSDGSDTGTACRTAGRQLSVGEPMGEWGITHIRKHYIEPTLTTEYNESRECTEDWPSHALSAFPLLQQCYRLFFYKSGLIQIYCCRQLIRCFSQAASFALTIPFPSKSAASVDSG